MRKLYRNCFICLFICLFSIILQAKEVNKQTAEKVAVKAFADLYYNKNVSVFQVKEILTVKSEEKTTFYIVNFKPTGFIILSASDAAIPVLGSSPESNLSLENLPTQLSYLLEIYKIQVKEIEKQKIVPTEDIKQQWNNFAREETSTSLNSLKSATTLPSQVAPILSTTWNQNIGYNRFCPVDSNGPGGHVYAGCVATAMAQILKKWGCQVNEFGTYSYSHVTYGTLSVDFNQADYSWSSMGNSPSDEFNARLIRDCGIAVNMSYGPKSSSAYISDAQSALSTFFGFKNTSAYVFKSSYTDSGWKDVLKQELSLSRPILYGGFTASNPPVGHSWVIDGYDSSDKFHCNWGCGGSGDGFFLLTNLTFDNGSTIFNNNNQAVIGLEPVMPNCDKIINGGTLVCSSGTAFNVPNLPIDATVTWNKSSNITFDNQPGNPKTFIANGSGSGWIEATVHYNGVATLNRKTVWVGIPPTPVVTSDQQLTVYAGQDIVLYDENLNSYPGLMGNFNWTWYCDGIGIYEAYDYGGGGKMYIFHEPGTARIRASVANACGSTNLSADVFVQVIAQRFLLSLSPNPAIGEATVEVKSSKEGQSDKAIEWDLEVYDSMQSLKEKKTKICGNQAKLNTTNLKDGVYIVRAKIGNDVITKKLVVKH